VVNPPRVEVEANGQAFRGVSAFVQNAHPYTYFRNLPIDVAEGAEVDSGDLAGAVLERASAIDMPLLIWRLLSQRARVVNHRRVGSFAGVTGVRARSADGRPVPVQVDGDYLGDRTAVEFAVAPGALTVVA
jgi:diacylglycerol kinase family enzyme